MRGNEWGHAGEKEDRKIGGRKEDQEGTEGERKEGRKVKKGNTEAWKEGTIRQGDRFKSAATIKQRKEGKNERTKTQRMHGRSG